MNSYKLTINIIAVIFALLLNQHSGYTEIKSEDLNNIYTSIKKYIKNDDWEKAKVLFDYFKNLARDQNQLGRFPDLKRTEMQIDRIAEIKLEQLYQYGQHQLNNAQFKEAVKTFEKIFHFDPKHREVKRLLAQAKILERLSLSTSDIKAAIVTSKTIDKKQTGLRIYKPEKCYNGYTLFAHQPLDMPPGMIKTSPVYLIDMQGNIIHQWIVYYGPMFARLTPKGFLLYITASGDTGILSLGLRKLDFQSNEKWYYPGLIDHDFQILDNNTFMIERDISLPTYICPIIEIIASDKNVLWHWRGDKHIKELEELLGINIQLKGDWAHNNTCAVIPENISGTKDSRFKKGNIIFSYDKLSTIGIIDYPEGEIVWAWGPGIIQNQHMPTMLNNGNLLVFDNGTGRGWSRIIELNPMTEKIVWEYHAEPKESFYTRAQGNATRLPNGNTLICESGSNRIFEITPGGEIVWDFISTFNKLTGTEYIYRAYRYSPDEVKTLLKLLMNKKQNQTSPK